MPRKARIQSTTGIYHIMMRGINQQQIFYEESDYNKFINLLQDNKEKCEYELFAFCLMGNHIHLLIKEGPIKIDSIIKRIGSSFAYWYNLRYQRTGHIFQDRFKSEPIETNEYFLTVYRYILHNPVKANLCSSPFTYKYSNARNYLLGTETFTSAPDVFLDIPKNHIIDFLRKDSTDECMDIDTPRRSGITDEVAIEMINSEFGTLFPNIGTPSSKNRANFIDSIKKLRDKGLAKNQLSRLIGLPKNYLQ